jgi:hypothetical protein
MLRITLLLLISLLILPGCATRYSVSVDYDDQFSFSGKQSYALIVPEDIQTTRNDLLKKRIESALHQQLKQQGYVQTNKQQASIWISYFATTEKQQDIRTYQHYNSFYGYARCYRCYYPMPVTTTDVQVINYTAGTLIIDVIEPASNTLKWRGSTTSKITTSQADSMSVQERTQRVNEAVAAILAQYPPGAEKP